MNNRHRTVSEAAQIEEEMVALAYGQLHLSSLAITFSALVLSAALWDVIDHRVILIWLAVTLSVSLLRYSSALYFETRRARYTSLQWKRLFLAGVFLSALTWASASALLFPRESPLHQAMLMIVFAGVSAGAIITLSPFLSAIRICLPLLLLPAIARMLLQGTPVHNWMALLTALFLLLLLRISKRFNDHNLKSVRSRLIYEKAKEALELNSERFDCVFQRAPAGIFLYDTDLRILKFNQRFVDILEAPPEYLTGLDMKTIPDQRPIPALYAAVDNRDGFYEGEYRTKFSRKSIWISMRTSPVLDSRLNVVGGIGIATDITAQINDRKRIRHLALYDSLTNSPNRTMLTERLRQEVIRFKRHHILTALLFLDLDHFKDVNDTLGHSAGDALLVEAAQRLQAILREEDFLSRIGGDEFVVLLPDLGTEREPARTKAMLVSQKIHKALEAPFKVKEHTLTTSASIGIALTDQKTTAEALLKHADTAMYEAKNSTRGSTIFYRPEMDRRNHRRTEIESALRGAAAAGEMGLHYQPIITFDTGRIIGAEALLRWKNPELGEMLPDTFIPIAEKSGLIVGIGEWVLYEACRQYREWQDQHSAAARLQKLSVNVSYRQLNDPTFVKKALHAIETYHIGPNHLELELNEEHIIGCLDDLDRKMALLHRHGIGISADNFGTGYASLSYLYRLPFSSLKIDRSFIRNIPKGGNGINLVRAIITIAESFHLNVIAQGVETEEEYRFLKKLGCHAYQGNYFSPPLPAAAFEALLREGRCPPHASPLEDA